MANVLYVCVFYCASQSRKGLVQFYTVYVSCVTQRDMYIKLYLHLVGDLFAKKPKWQPYLRTGSFDRPMREFRFQLEMSTKNP